MTPYTCQSCRAVVTDWPHTCPPLWWCWVSGTGECDGAAVRGTSAVSAAAAYVRANHEPVDGDEVPVSVRDGSQVWCYRVEVEVTVRHAVRVVE